MTKITEISLGLAAQCWCDEDTSGIEMDSHLAIAFAKRLDAKDKQIAELKEQVEAATTFNVDVIRCLSRIASVENHNEVPAYIDMSRRCIKAIEAKQAKALKEQE
jgi:hypothetical protein